jgi:hypothetical protein
VIKFVFAIAGGRIGIAEKVVHAKSWDSQGVIETAAHSALTLNLVLNLNRGGGD